MSEIVDAGLLAFICAQTLLSILIFVKLRRVLPWSIRSEIAAQVKEAFRQSELSRVLTYELGLEHPLPPMGGWAASADFLLLVARCHRERRPLKLLECGSGVSTVVLAACCRREGAGHVLSLEHNPIYVENTRDELARYGLSDWATVVHAPLEPVELSGSTWTWYQTSHIPAEALDLVLIDGPPGHSRRLARYPAGPLLLSKLACGGVSFLDDADRPDEREIVRRWRVEMTDLIFANHSSEKGCVSIELPYLA